MRRPYNLKKLKEERAKLIKEQPSRAASKWFDSTGGEYEVPPADVLTEHHWKLEKRCLIPGARACAFVVTRHQYEAPRWQLAYSKTQTIHITERRAEAIRRRMKKGEKLTDRAKQVLLEFDLGL